MKKLAIIGSGDMASIIAENAKKMNVYTYSFSNQSKDTVIGVSDEHFKIDIFELKKLESLCKKLNIDGVIATTELTIQIAAKLSNLLGLNGMSVNIAEKITDKSYVRKNVENSSLIHQPHYFVYEKGGIVPTIKKYPVIVKPTSMGGKRGITVAHNKQELNVAIQHALQSMSISQTKIIIEQFISEGKEYSVECLSFHNTHKVIQVTEKISSGAPHCVELGHMQPANITIPMLNKIRKTVSELLTITGVNNTASHVEIKIVDNEIYLIELNARLGGDYIAYPLTELSTGYPYIQGSIEIALNSFSEPDINNFDSNYCGILFVAQQTFFLKQLFEECDNYKWLYKKNLVSDNLQEIVNNHASNTNYIIYLSNNIIPKEIKNALKKYKNLQ